jgi:mono/diheme cytochrome c family protein
MNNNIIYGVTGLFNKPNDIIHAAEKVANSGYQKWDVNTPYPVHGMDQAMKLKSSTMGFFALGLGLMGTFLAVLFIWWTMVYDYPIVIGGKPFFALPAFIPVMFEVTVIMATIGSVLSMLFIFFKVPNNSHPLHDTDYMKACSSDHYGVCLEAKDPQFDEAEARALLESLGAMNVATIYYDNEEINHEHRIFHPKFIGFLALASLLTITITYSGFNIIQYTAPFNWMEFQPKLSAQSPTDFFEDGFSMRQPVEGSVARGFMPYLYTGKPDSAAKYLSNSLPATKEVIAMGKVKYDTYCSPCHDFVGNGESRLNGQFPNPPSLHSEKLRNWTDGRIFHVITDGQNVMPSYSSQLNTKEKWAVVHYVRALQRALNAKEEDL